MLVEFAISFYNVHVYMFIMYNSVSIIQCQSNTRSVIKSQS